MARGPARLRAVRFMQFWPVEANDQGVDLTSSDLGPYNDTYVGIIYTPVVCLPSPGIIYDNHTTPTATRSLCERRLCSL